MPSPRTPMNIIRLARSQQGHENVSTSLLVLFVWKSRRLNSNLTAQIFCMHINLSAWPRKQFVLNINLWYSLLFCFALFWTSLSLAMWSPSSGKNSSNYILIHVNQRHYQGDPQQLKIALLCTGWRKAWPVRFPSHCTGVTCLTICSSYRDWKRFITIPLLLSLWTKGPNTRILIGTQEKSMPVDETRVEWIRSINQKWRTLILQMFWIYNGHW